MPVTTATYSVYERLASAKMNSMVAQINAHTHDGTYGTQLSFSNILGTITGANIGIRTITGEALGPGNIALNTITGANIAASSIEPAQLNLTNIHLVDGYAVYSP